MTNRVEAKEPFVTSVCAGGLLIHRTLAMRQGFADRPLVYADLLWPGEKIPTPKKIRRKGRALKL